MKMLARQPMFSVFANTLLAERRLVTLPRKLLTFPFVVLLFTCFAAPMHAADRAVVSRAPVYYPSMAKQMRITGDVTVVAKVDPSGKVLSAVSDSPYKLLVPAAVDSVKQWKFAPGTETTTVTVMVHFTLQ
jgi:TonB family protein